MPEGGHVNTVHLDQVAEDLGYRAYDPSEDRERARKVLAYGLLALLAAIIGALLAAEILGQITIDESKDLAAAVMGPVVALVGTVLGFYFGSKSD